jgi:ABC-type oligopeptide transport system ATPase subunit
MSAMSVQGLTKDFTLREGRTHRTLRAVDDVSLPGRRRDRGAGG